MDVSVHFCGTIYIKSACFSGFKKRLMNSKNGYEKERNKGVYKVL